MPTVRKRSDVDQVEKQLKKKNITLSKLESRVKLFNRMIRSGISTADVDSFTKKQSEIRIFKTKPCEKTKRTAMKAKLNDTKAAIATTRRERRNLKRELEYLLRNKKHVMEEKLEKLKEQQLKVSQAEDIKNADKFKHLFDKQLLQKSVVRKIPGDNNKKEGFMTNIPDNILEITNEISVFNADLSPEPADGPMVCNSNISLSPDEILPG